VCSSDLDARLVVVRAQQLRSNIIAKRRARFTRAISTRSQSVLEIDFWSKFIVGFNGLGKSFRLLVADSYAIAKKRLAENPWKGLLLILGLVIGGVFYRFVHGKTKQFVAYSDDEMQDTQAQKSIRAAAKFANTGLLNVLALAFVHYLIASLELYTDRMAAFAWVAFYAVGLAVIANSLALVFLAPNRQQDRIADLTDSAARETYRIGMVAVVLVAICYVLNDTAITLVAPFQMSVGLSAVLALIIIVAAIWIMFLVSRDRVGHMAPLFQEFRLIRWLYLRPLIWIAVFISVTALVTGFIAFAEFTALQILIGAIIIAILWLALDLIDTFKSSILLGEENPERLSRIIGIQPSRVKQLSILGFGLGKMLIFLIAALALLLPWGYRTSDWLEWINGAFFGFQVGGLSISFSTILMALALFVVGFAITKAIQNWLSTQFLPTIDMDGGLRNSISTVLGYIGFVLVAMLAISAAGLDLSNLAIVAGALSVGVGFGLQSIVNNFVSGLILLAERPIKAGDWVVTSGGEGTVRKISVRSTEIETFDRATIILPNSTLITDAVTNWTHSSKLGRIKIAIGVGYDSDPDQVHDLLLGCITSHERVLKNPRPKVFFLDFGEDALLFEMRGYLSNIEDGLSVKSELRYSILRTLRKANIEIPYPQRDIHIKSGSLSPSIPSPKPRRRSTRTKS